MYFPVLITSNSSSPDAPFFVKQFASILSLGTLCVILEEATSRNTLEEAPDSVDDDNELLEALEEEGNSNTTLIALSLKHNYLYHK